MTASPMLTVFFSFLGALFIALYLAPVLIRAAHRYGIVDAPQGALKTHKEPVPYLGGLVVFLAVLLTVAVAMQPFDQQTVAMLLGASLVVAVGLVDDLGTLTPRDKLIGQIIAAAIMVKAGIKIDLVVWPFPWAELLSGLWLVTCMNAFNILDVSDGLSSTAGVIGALALGVAGTLTGAATPALVCAALAGAGVGFLWFNKAPARMYLGDTGSMLFGVLLGAMALMARYSDENELAPYLAPIAFLFLPLFDLGLVIVARLWAKKPVYHGSPDHFAVRLKDHGLSANQVALVAAVVGAGYAGAGVWAAQASFDVALLIFSVSVAVAFLLLGTVLWRFPARTSPRFAPKSAPAAKVLPKSGQADTAS